MFHLPREVDPEPVGHFHLLQGVVEELLFLAVGPRPRQLVLVENAELHQKVHREETNA